MKRMVVLLHIVSLTVAGASGAASNPDYPPLPVLGPTALVADPGDGRAYLRWNLQLEDPRVLGWRVLQLKPVQTVLTPTMLREPAYVARDLQNGESCTFAVVGVLADGTTPESSPVTVTPRPTGEAKIITAGNQRLSFGEFRDVVLREPAIRIVFPDGQELTYANCRPVDWKTREGEHLLYPRPFGNNVDIGQFQKSGLPRIIPPEGLKDAALPGGVYRDVQYGLPHPHLTDPLTVPYDEPPHDTGMRWRPPAVDGDRVTVEYWVPLTLWGYTAWTYVRVWETWWPIEADRHGTKYHGLARLVEVEMPSALKNGYQVMLNNGFGPAGSRKGVVSYSSGFRVPGHEVVDFTGDHNRAVTFQSPKFPRAGGGYHPTQDSLQSSPLIFYDWGKGSLTITARSLYYHCANNSASYPEQGADGVWPNLAWDMAMAGRRTAVDTVEYLYTTDMTLPLPQRYVNARFETYGNVSRRMGVQDALTGVVMEQHHIKPNPQDAPVAGMIDKIIAERKDMGIDDIGIFLAFWHIAPYAVDPDYRIDPDYALNRDIKAAIATLRAAGFCPGFWFRPEVAKTSMPSILSDKIPDAEYDWFFNCRYPDLPQLIAKRGIPVVRNNTNWIRRQSDGGWPEKTPYNWVEMSLASRWWDEVVWPALVTSKKLGFDWLLMDGGFGGLAGVDYAPMLAGQAPGAVPCQPYWWRMFRSMKLIGMSNVGECTLGWRGGDVVNIGNGDQYFQWMFNQGTIYDNSLVTAPEQIHKFFQLYNNQQRQGRNPIGTDAIRRYAKRFYAAHRAPDWIEFKNLKPGEPVTKTLRVTDSPVAGAATRVGDTLAETIVPWTWDDVVWHYDDGTSVTYPAYEKIDWAKLDAPARS